MKTKNYIKNQLKPGVTLIELTVVIVVILSLISVLFIGATAYRNAANRSACIVQMRSIHQAAIGHMNMTGSTFGGTVQDNAGDDSDYATELYGPGLYFEEAPTCPRTPDEGYAFVKAADTYPDTVNESAVTCIPHADEHIFTP